MINYTLVTTHCGYYLFEHTDAKQASSLQLIASCPFFKFKFRYKQLLYRQLGGGLPCKDTGDDEVEYYVSHLHNIITNRSSDNKKYQGMRLNSNRWRRFCEIINIPLADEIRKFPSSNSAMQQASSETTSDINYFQKVERIPFLMTSFVSGKP